MADFAGNLFPSGIFTAEPTNPDIGFMVEPDYLLVWTGNPDLTNGLKANTQPVDEIPQDRAGNHQKAFGFLDWYERLHVEPLIIDLGNVVSVQERPVSIWNAFFVPRTLVSVVAVGDTGVVLTLPAPPPFDLQPLEQAFYTFSISTEGPPTVDADFTFTFDVAEFVVHVQGIRIVAWVWEANWVNPVIERLGFSTDVQEAYDGSEQRAQLMGGARIEWEFSFDVRDSTRRLFENIIFGWGGNNWAVPIWTDVTALAAPLLAGAEEIPIDTAGRDYHALGLGIVVGPDGTYEAFGIDSVDPDAVNLQAPIIATWPIGSKVYPARSARLLDPRATQRFYRNYARGVARFESIEEITHDALDETLYRDLPVMEREMNWREGPELDYARKLEVSDFRLGAIVVTDESELAIAQPRFVFTCMNREDCDYLREWIYARKGRCRGIWLPTWCDDLKLTNLVATSSLNIDVEACGLVHFAESEPGRRDIRVQLKNGNVYYRRVTDPSAPNELTERLVLNAVFPEQFEPEDVERISWMHYVRLDADSIELTWATPTQLEAVLPFKGPRNEL